MVDTPYKREDWHTEQADEFERSALDVDAGYGPQSRIVFALLSVGARIAELTQELRRRA